MSSLKRMLEILDLYSVDHALLTAEEISNLLSYSRGSTYRYLKELTTAGLLINAAGGYAPGPRVIELDFVIRQNDPYSSVIQPVVQSLNDQFQCEVLASSYYRGRVVVTHHIKGSDELTMSFGRGRRMPLFLGAGSKVILAGMKKRQLQLIYENSAEQRTSSIVPPNWDDFYAEMSKIRRAGHAVSRSELDVGNVGVAVPLSLNSMGSIVLVFTSKRYEMLDQKRVAKLLMGAAEQANAMITNIESGGPQVDWLVPPNPIVKKV